MRLTLFTIGLCCAGAAAAQPAANGQPDNAAILKALEAISGRLDRLEKRETPRKPSSGSIAGPAAAKTAPVEPAGTAIAGWYVHLVPWTEDPNSGMAIGGFPGAHFEFNLNQHTPYVGDQTRYIYNGKSFFHPQEAGNYVFSIVLEPVTGRNPLNYNIETFNCSGELLLGGNRVIAGYTAFEQPMNLQNELYRSQAVYGQIQLEKKPYRAEFRVDCWPARNKNFATYDALLSLWKKNRFKIMVKPPNGPMARPLLSQEIYYVGIP